MSDYVEIFNPDPIVIPAQEEKTYPNLYAREFYVYPPDAEGKQALVSNLRSYNKDTKEMYPFEDRDQKFALDDIFLEAERVPLFKQVLGGILTCISLGIEERKLIADLSADPSNEELQADLAAVHAAMGIQP